MRLGHVNILPLSAWAVAFCVITATVRADSVAPPYSYSKPSPDGRFLFVMIARGTVEDDARHWNEHKAGEIRAIRQTYSKTGLYRNAGSSTPLWTVNWYAYDVDVASDGRHLVRYGPWASRSDQEAFSFFADGQLIRSYAISELIDLKFLLPHSVSHFQWSAGGRFDDAVLHYAVSTKDGNSFVFDVTDGSIIRETRHARTEKWAGLVTIASAVIAVITLARRRGRTRITQGSASC